MSVRWRRSFRLRSWSRGAESGSAPLPHWCKVEQPQKKRYKKKRSDTKERKTKKIKQGSTSSARKRQSAAMPAWLPPAEHKLALPTSFLLCVLQSFTSCSRARSCVGPAGPPPSRGLRSEVPQGHSTVDGTFPSPLKRATHSSLPRIQRANGTEWHPFLPKFSKHTGVSISTCKRAHQNLYIFWNISWRCLPLFSKVLLVLFGKKIKNTPLL